MQSTLRIYTLHTSKVCINAFSCNYTQLWPNLAMPRIIDNPEDITYKWLNALPNGVFQSLASGYQPNIIKMCLEQQVNFGKSTKH